MGQRTRRSIECALFRLQNAHLLYRACNINILLFDYRGYGKSTGAPSEAGLYTDALAVHDYVRKRNDLNQEKIFLFGRSLGGAVALHLGKSATTVLLDVSIDRCRLCSFSSCSNQCYSTIICSYHWEHLHIYSRYGQTTVPSVCPWLCAELVLQKCGKEAPAGSDACHLCSP